MYSGGTFKKSMNYYSFREREAKNAVVDFVGKYNLTGSSRERGVEKRHFLWSDLPLSEARPSLFELFLLQ